MGRRLAPPEPRLEPIEELRRRRRVLRRALVESIPLDGAIYRRHQARAFRFEDLPDAERLAAEIDNCERTLREAGVR
jgi:hypothetical protein